MNFGTLFQGSTHSYPQPGTYTIEWDAVYTDRNSPVPVGTGGGWYDQQFDVAAYQTVIVGRASPTIGVTGTASIAEQQNYLLYSTFANPTLSQETPQLWTISWGDGHTSVYQGYSARQFAHAYGTAGNETIGVTLATNEGTYTASWNVSVTAPTLSISGSTAGVAYEDSSEGSTYSTIIVTRSVSSPLPLNVSFTIGGTANASEYELTDSAGDILTNTVTIPASATLCTIYVNATEDETPSWTDTLELTLGPSTAYTIGASGVAGTQLVNDDLGITLAQGSGNQVLLGSDDGTQNLEPLVLHYPQEMKDGAALTLSVSQPDDVVVWPNNDPQGEDVPVLGRGTASVSYVYGTDELPPQTLWVGGLSHSVNVNDITFTLSDSDAGTTPAPAHPTTNTVKSNPATCITVQIKELDNNSQFTNADVAGKTQNWLVGQMVDLKVDVGAPVGVKMPNVRWSIPGNILADYNDAAQNASQTAVAGKVTVVNGRNYTDVGTQQAEVKFFWVANTNGQATEDDEVSVVVGAILGSSVGESAMFHVQEPVYSFNIPSHGQTTKFVNGNVIWAALGDPTQNPFQEGILITGNVTLPAGVAGTGNWKIIQVATFNRTATASPPGGVPAAIHLPLNNSQLLDAGDPYPLYWVNNAEAPARNGMAAVYTTGQIETMYDSPQQSLNSITVDLPGNPNTDEKGTEVTVKDQFQTYLMFKPPGDSKWVPLYLQGWVWNMHALINPQQNDYNFDLAQTNGPTPNGAVATLEPQWNAFAPIGLPNWVP